METRVSSRVKRHVNPDGPSPRPTLETTSSTWRETTNQSSEAISALPATKPVMWEEQVNPRAPTMNALTLEATLKTVVDALFRTLLLDDLSVTWPTLLLGTAPSSPMLPSLDVPLESVPSQSVTLDSWSCRGPTGMSANGLSKKPSSTKSTDFESEDAVDSRD